MAVMRRLWRIAAIMIWTIGAFIGWMWALSLGGQLLVNAANRHAWPPPPEWVLRLCGAGMLGVTILIIVWTVLLGLRGRLPGTRTGPVERQQGFPMDAIRNED